jgi:hypothetical protein
MQPKNNKDKTRIAYTIFTSTLLIASAAVTALLISVSSTYNNAAYAHTFSQNESALYLSLTEKIRAEAQLVVNNLQAGGNNLTIAKAHANNAVNLLNNGTTISELRERNNRVADALINTLQQLSNNVSALSSTASGQAISPQAIQNVNQTVSSLNDTLGEATTVRIDPDQRENTTTWALAFADLSSTLLKQYGTAIDSPVDLSNMSNMAMMMNMGASNSSGSSMSSMNGGGMKMSSNNNMQSSATSTKIVNDTAYQTARFLSGRSLVQVFNDHLKNSSAAKQHQQQTDQLQKAITDLANAINNKESGNNVMMIVHGTIHPSLIQIFGLKAIGA